MIALLALVLWYVRPLRPVAARHLSIATCARIYQRVLDSRPRFRRGVLLFEDIAPPGVERAERFRVACDLWWTGAI